MNRFPVPEGKDPMSALCRMVVETRFEDLPAEVVAHVKESILDTLGVTIGGSAMEGIPTVVQLVKERGGTPESTIPFYGGKVPAAEAGFAIGPMARAMDFGDLHDQAGHCSEYILSTLMAATGLKEKISGKDFIAAFAVGQEVLIRTGAAFNFWASRPIRTIGGHYIFGSTAAVGKLLALTQDEMENAEGMVLEMNQPYSISMYSPATLMVRIHHGFVSQASINACILAQRGITGPRLGVLAGNGGYLAMAKWRTRPGLLSQSLGEEWKLLELVKKPYSACHNAHTAIYGIIEQMEANHFEAEDISEMRIQLSPIMFPGVCNPKDAKWHPLTVGECQFSLPYVVATAAHDKHVFLDSYTEKARNRPEVRQLMTRISAEEDGSLKGFSARVYTTLKDGRSLSGLYKYPKGHPKNRFTRQEMVEKFKMCVPFSAYKLTEDTVDSLVRSVLGLENIGDVVGTLILPLTPP